MWEPWEADTWMGGLGVGEHHAQVSLPHAGQLISPTESVPCPVSAWRPVLLLRSERGPRDNLVAEISDYPPAAEWWVVQSSPVTPIPAPHGRSEAWRAHTRNTYLKPAG